MAYIAPSKDSISFDMGGAYSAPTKEGISFVVGGSSTTVVFCPPFEIAPTIEPPVILWFTVLPTVEVATSLGAPMVTLAVSLPPFSVSVVVSIRPQPRAFMVPLSLRSVFLVRSVYVLPENTTGLGPWPFCVRSILVPPVISVVLSAAFEIRSVLEPPVIMANGEAVVDLPALKTESRFRSNLQPQLELPSFLTETTLEIMAIKTMPFGDCYLETPGFSVSSAVSLGGVQSLLPVPGFGIQARLDVGAIYVGQIVSCVALEVVSSIQAMMFNAVIVPHFHIASELDVNILVDLIVNSFEVSGVLEITDIFVGVFIECKPWTVRALWDVGIGHSLYLPEFQVATEFAGDLQRFMGLPVLSVRSEFQVKDILLFTVELADVYYFFTLTGGADSLPDIEIPMSSFQCRMRSGDPSYLQVVIPGLSYAGAIAARPRGTLRVSMAYKLDGQVVRKKAIVEADFDTFRLDEGVKSQTITLSGHRTETFIPKEIALSGEVYKSTISGKRRFRLARPSMDLRAGDTVNIGGETFTAGLISYYFRATQGGINQNMEVAEI